MKSIRSIIFLVILFNTPLLFAQTPPASAIASSHPLATKAGMEILKQGGNAFDAAVTVGAVLAVVEPYQSGLGGGGFWLLHQAKGQFADEIVIDARERAPQAAKANMFIDKNGKANTQLAQIGPLAAAIPGEVAGLVYLAEHYGRLPLATTLAPAISLAENGFLLDAPFVKMVAEHQKEFTQFPSTTEIFLNNGQLPKAKTLFKQPELANVLKAIAKEGRRGFYEGQVAKALVDGVKEKGGIWELDDLKNYQVEVHKPLYGAYHHLKLTTIPLPSAGGIGLIEALNILAQYQLVGLSEADRKHLITESLRRVYCDRMLYLGDFEQGNVGKLLAKKHAIQWHKNIQIDKATSSKSLNCGVPFQEGEHTAHYSILDQEGNSVAATVTLNHHFGSRFVAPKTGIFLNNEMDDFGIQVGVANGYQLVGHQANSIGPGKKPLSSMAPTFLYTSEGMGILGTPGGSRIPSMTLLAILEAEHDKSPKTWVSAPRFHQQYWPDVIYFEPDAFSLHIQHALQIRGHKLKQTEKPYGNMQAIFWDKAANEVYAASDPRGQGLALVEKIPLKSKK
ncbi:MAG: gamma-glutamyltransferase [Candidatus Berkiellales bacterium]